MHKLIHINLSTKWFGRILYASVNNYFVCLSKHPMRMIITKRLLRSTQTTRPSRKCVSKRPRLFGTH